MHNLILVLIILAAVLFVIAALSRFLKFQILGHEPTIWWRGSMGLLGFSIAFLLCQILKHMPPR
ncbi:MAG TPA: hypothetical protein VJY15_08160 [Candidatus Acidoferrum sp.]|nr:hypothetical protein [Candidatus Acidoferrum sp.]